MKTIELSNGDTYATNNSGEGVFVLDGGAFRQLAGTGQASIATPEALRRWLRKELGVRGVRIVGTMGW